MSRKNDTPVEKVANLRRHLIDRVSISDLCDEYQLSPTLFYSRQKLSYENVNLLSSKRWKDGEVVQDP
jgi:transposase